MTSVDTPSKPKKTGSGGGEFKRFLLGMLDFVGNLVLAGLVLCLGLISFGSLLSLWVISSAQGSEFLDVSGWLVLLGLISAMLFYEGGRGIKEWISDRLGETVPIWRFSIATALAAIVMFGASWVVVSVPLQLDVDRGEIRILDDGQGTIMTSGTLRGSRYAVESRVYQLRRSINGFGVALPMNQNEWVVARVSFSYELEPTPELQALIAEHPPAFNSHGVDTYLDNLVVSLVVQELTQLVREEARPGNTTTGDVSGWPHTGASVPMSVRLGLRLENNQDTLPTWLKHIEVSGVSIDTWNYRQ